ncbi:Flp pilus assembly protein CpaB [Rhodocyclus purpureus]|uniref:Flp pilus assembly protein CpaB n=1 Tax=Rhodocyclus purpureus TaxID=1067 RepID=UPI001911FCB9|nr:Flp pilus assembly protein CpaB [Rhodocyclus purpureus]MBK5915466.1 Flp pilus assembly protein CpaB [Rhodocyclus purpureus]
MKPSYLIGIALVLGAIAAFLVSRWLNVGVGGAGGPTVVVATEKIEAGAPIDPAKLKAIAWPYGSAPPEAVADPAQLAGRVTRQEIWAGQPVLVSLLLPVDSRGGLAAIISEGMRAVTVRVDDVIGVAGFVLPGSMVDVLATFKDDKGKEVAKIVLSRVKVLAVAQETAGDPAKPKVVKAVTLELSPQEAERLDLARNVGKLSLALRNELDKAEGPTNGASISKLLDGEAAGDAARRAPDGACKEAPRRSARTAASPHREVVEELHGGQRSVVVFGGSGAR